MSGGTKPRKKRRVWEKLNPITVALNSSTRYTDKELAGLLAPLVEAQDALRKGQLTQQQWVILATNNHLAVCIEAQGIVKGLGDQLLGAQVALRTIESRAVSTGTWKPPTCYAAELLAIDDQLFAFKFQMQNLAANEFQEAVRVAKARENSYFSKFKRAVK